MAKGQPTEPITVRAAKDIIAELDSLAAVMDRSRNYVVVQALQDYLSANAWQLERIRDGLDDAREGRVIDSEVVFERIASRNGWTK
jgi:predicted transcriptional regulator